MFPYKLLQKGIEGLFEDLMTVTVEKGTRKDPETFETIPDVEVIYRDEPCRLSYGSSNHSEGEFITKGEQVIKLFTRPDVVIPQGSKIEVKRQGAILLFGKSDEPYRYGSHCEYLLSNWKESR